MIFAQAKFLAMVNPFVNVPSYQTVEKLPSPQSSP